MVAYIKYTALLVSVVIFGTVFIGAIEGCERARERAECRRKVQESYKMFKIIGFSMEKK